MGRMDRFNRKGGFMSIVRCEECERTRDTDYKLKCECKKMLKKKQSEKTTHKARSKKLTEWRNSWFGKN